MKCAHIMLLTWSFILSELGGYESRLDLHMISRSEVWLCLLKAIIDNTQINTFKQFDVLGIS